MIERVGPVISVGDDQHVCPLHKGKKKNPER